MPAQTAAAARTAMNLSFNFVDAKLRGRRRKLYEGERLQEVVRSRTVREMAESLFPEDTPSGPLQLQKRLDQRCVDELSGFLSYLDDARGSLLRTLIGRYRVWNLKIALRLFGRDSAVQRADELMLDLPGSLQLPREELLDSSNGKEFVNTIPDDILREAALGALDLFKNTQRRAYLEMALDRGWWRALMSALGELHSWDRRGCMSVLKAESFMLRLLTVLRGTRLYELNWQTLAEVLPPAPGGGEQDHLKEIHENPTSDRIADSISDDSELSLEPDEAEDLSDLEDTLWDQVMEVANRQFYTALGGTGSLVAYYYLKMAERKKLVSLSEMLRRGTPEDERLEALQPLSYRRGGN